MIEINDTLISEEIIEKDFVCNLDACKGACCVEGDAGAPVEQEEVPSSLRKLCKYAQIFLVEIILTGQAFWAFSQASRMLSSCDLRVKKPFFSVERNRTVFPSFLLIWNCSGAISTQ